MRDYRAKQKRHRQGDGRAVGAGEKKVLVTVRLEESVAARISRMVVEASATGKYPWRTPGEFYRGLIKRGLEFLRDQHPEEWAQLEPILKMRAQLDAMTSQRTEAQGFAARVKQEIAELLRMGARPMAAQLYIVSMNTATQMPPTVYRNWLIDDLKKRYHYLREFAPKGVSFRDQTAKQWGHDEERRHSARKKR
jgi:hypothetical protein